ncbi:hypothetical protein [Ornithinimicrobium pratense]|uniref:hypothetical protein n=1 Tax=Ornithinimicrobium pratense TaxID=2593973 RepID=UPI00307F3A76
MDDEDVLAGAVDEVADFEAGLAADDSAGFALPVSEVDVDAAAAAFSPEDPDDEPDPRESVR